MREKKEELLSPDGLENRRAAPEGMRLSAAAAAAAAAAGARTTNTLMMREYPCWLLKSLLSPGQLGRLGTIFLNLKRNFHWSLVHDWCKYERTYALE